MTDAELRVRIYREFVETGRAPSAAALAQSAAMPVEEVRASLEQLAAGRTIALQPRSREIMFAAPLSAVPTPHVVHALGRSFFAPCSWDAFGAVAMLHCDGVIESSCACCGEAMSIEMRDGRPGRIDGLVHFALPASRWWDDIAFT